MQVHVKASSLKMHDIYSQKNFNQWNLVLDDKPLNLWGRGGGLISIGSNFSESELYILIVNPIIYPKINLFFAFH